MSKKIKELLPEYSVKMLSAATIIAIVLIFYFVISKAMPVIKASGFGLLTKTGFDQQIREGFASSADDPMLTFGMLAPIIGTLLSTLLALLAAGVLAIGAAAVICEMAPRGLATVLTAIVRLLASIPSVVFGLIGVIAVVPLVEKLFITVDMQIDYLEFFQMTGRNMLSSAIVLTFMIVPTIISLSIDAIRAVPNSRREIGYAFGMSRFRVIWKIVLPSARSGIVAGMILGAGRGIGESIAVSMVCGGTAYIPNILHGFAAMLSPILPLSSAIINKSEAMSSPAVESALFACGAILLLMGAILSALARLIERRMRRRAGYAD
ncbi:MAG: phosphate ABC transporter permease subunit PstC [Oscillospiraceae bacterium]|nr:phosphate ABC transporter permease subunit PstC [Oscillospiraceae bacterium]